MTSYTSFATQFAFRRLCRILWFCLNLITLCNEVGKCLYKLNFMVKRWLLQEILGGRATTTTLISSSQNHTQHQKNVNKTSNTFTLSPLHNIFVLEKITKLPTPHPIIFIRMNISMPIARFQH